MTAITQIITDAYREANLIALGASESTAQQTEALRLLNRYINALFGFELGEPLTNQMFGTNNISAQSVETFTPDVIEEFYIPINLRLILNLTEAKTLNLYPTPMDGARFGIADASGNLNTYNLTVSGNGHTIEDAATLVLSDDGLNREWFYRADLANWVRLSDLTTVDDSPFPSEFDDLLIIGLALRLVGPRYGGQVSNDSKIMYSQLLSKFKARYRQTTEMPLEDALRIITPYGTRSVYVKGPVFSLGIV